MNLKDYEYYRTDLGVLYCGDCLEVLPLLKCNECSGDGDVPSNTIDCDRQTCNSCKGDGRLKVDLVLTDPPYGVNIGKSGKFFNSNFGVFDWDKEIPKKQIFDMLLKYKNQIIFGGNYFPFLWSNGCKGYIFWNKLNHNEKMGDGELAWTSFNQGCKYYEYMWDGNRYGEVGNIKGVGKKSNRQHPTQKPVKLMEWVLNDYSDKNHLILDSFFGSGTVGVACEKLNRRWIGIEISEKYCEIAKQRIKAEADQIKMF